MKEVLLLESHIGLAYAPRVTAWGFQFGNRDNVFVVPIFGGTVSVCHARSSMIKSVLSFGPSTNSSLNVTRNLTLIHHRSSYTV